MERIMWIYLSGVIFNLITFLVYLIKDFNELQVNILPAISFILASWFIYPILLWRERGVY
ncbi:hypothetical protein MWH25_01135 [Natroniella acetigena]|uniref:hypothetical protein n=1 Tax=Natroniella acetigena TaxID=52004 RepID=UPI00200A2D9F|nr:hypothetical protein [Natroniella acetigena]MCK8826351.1 hypothetical protein [Natroniella acetigena]